MHPERVERADVGDLAAKAGKVVEEVVGRKGRADKGAGGLFVLPVLVDPVGVDLSFSLGLEDEGLDAVDELLLGILAAGLGRERPRAEKRLIEEIFVVAIWG